MTIDEVRAALADPDTLSANAMRVLNRIAAACASEDDESARDLVIRALHHRDRLGALEPVLSSLAREVGLFPYADPAALSEPQLLALEAHRPAGRIAEDYVFHAEQALAYQILLGGENLILSASTSFGKSLIIDGVLATGRFVNVAVIVPTIALLDETRRRLSRFSSYKLITHPSQGLGDRNLFVMTQERLLEYPDLPRVDFFAIDEFYKLDAHMDRDRASLLNQVLYQLLKGGGQFYLLGPSVDALADDVRLDARFIQTPFKTVALDIHTVPRAAAEHERLVAVCRGLEEPTIIYCRSPLRTRAAAKWLIDAGVSAPDPRLQPTVAWIAANYDREWLVGRALEHGIGIHHGRLPRALGHQLVRLFNEGLLRFLICTSTLIEGVNTAAKNVVIFDNRVAQQKFDFFTFNNIRGRSGRMFRHFIGRVFLFHEPPVAELPQLDIPAVSQSEDASTELLLQMDQDDLTPASKQRLEPYLHNPYLDAETLRANSGVLLDAQIRVAEIIHADVDMWHRRLRWTGMPSWDSLRYSCELVWILAAGSTRAGSARSPSQLGFLLRRLSAARGNVRDMVVAERRPDDDPDETVERVLDFIRHWPSHHFPRLLLALQAIETDVFGRYGLQPGDYGYYASRVEHLFLPRFAPALEEYGLPSQVAVRIPGLLADADSLDDVLDRLRTLPPRALESLNPFELEVLADASESI